LCSNKRFYIPCMKFMKHWYYCNPGVSSVLDGMSHSLKISRFFIDHSWIDQNLTDQTVIHWSSLAVNDSAENLSTRIWRCAMSNRFRLCSSEATGWGACFTAPACHAESLPSQFTLQTSLAKDFNGQTNTIQSQWKPRKLRFTNSHETWNQFKQSRLNCWNSPKEFAEDLLFLKVSHDLGTLNVKFPDRVALKVRNQQSKVHLANALPAYRKLIWTPCTATRDARSRLTEIKAISVFHSKCESAVHEHMSPASSNQQCIVLYDWPEILQAIQRSALTVGMWPLPHAL
jgi:hypothetical protein